MQIFVRDPKFYKKLIAIAVPIALQNLITVMVSMMDTLMIGQLGETQLSATSIANQLWFVLMVVCFGVAGGANVLIAQYWGKKETPIIRRVQAMTFKACFVISLFFMVVGLLWPSQFMSIFTPDQQVIELGAIYLRTIAWSYPFYALASVGIMMLRSVGTVNISVVVYLTSLVVNTTLNYILIFGKLGAPALGIQGGAIATAIARCFEFAITFGYYLFKERKIRFKLSDLRTRNRDLYAGYIEQALPIIGNELMWGIGTAMVAVVIGRMGTAFVAANSIYMVLNQFVSVMIFGVGNAALTIVGNTIGTGDFELAKQRSLTLYTLGVLIGIIAAVMTLVLGPVLLMCYNNLSVEAVSIMREITYVGAVVVFFQALAVVGMVGILRAGGDSRFVFVCEMIFLWGIALPLGFLTGLWLKWPPVAVYMLLRIDEIFKVLVCTVRILRFRWLRDVTVRQDSM